jgi:hypothetical protein
MTPMIVEKATYVSSIHEERYSGDKELSATLQFSKVMTQFEVRFLKTFSLSHKKVLI